MKKLSIILFTIIFTILTHAQDWDTVKIKQMLAWHDATMIVLGNSANQKFVYNARRSKQRFLPASTFKIPNSLIGLETKVIADENFVIKWDGINRDNKEWNRDHSLATAIKYSVVPYYQELARRVGRENYVKIFSEFDYGNKTIGDKIDLFWLDCSLKISAEEQIIFLKNFYEYKIPFSKRNIDIVKKIISEEKYEHSILKFKTGTGRKEDKTWIAWLVGYVERKNNTYFFAFNVDGKTYDEAKKIRDEIPRKILIDMKFIQQQL